MIAFFLSVTGLVLNAATYEPRLAEHILPLHPRYQRAKEAHEILKDRKYAAQGDGGATIQVGVLDIDHPSWRIMLDFIQSEIAIRKSERNEPGPAMFSPPTSPGASAPPKPVELPPIDFNRLKAITSVEFGTIKAGPKPLSPPYRLIVFFPHGVARRVYEFLSFQEFWLDLRQMLVGEVRFGSIVASGCALLVSGVLALLKWLVQRAAPQLLQPPTPASVTLVASTPTPGQSQGEREDAQQGHEADERAWR